MLSLVALLCPLVSSAVIKVVEPPIMCFIISLSTLKLAQLLAGLFFFLPWPIVIIFNVNHRHNPLVFQSKHAFNDNGKQVLAL